MKNYIGNNCMVELLPTVQSKQNLIESKIQLQYHQNKEDAFFIGDLGDIILKYRNWVNRLPRVHPFYAVKCNDDHAVLKILADLGASFDCASKFEIQKILNLGVDPSRIIYANPCKQTSFIKFSASKYVYSMTFDNEAELHKIKAVFPAARLVLRILPASGFKAQFQLGVKFGCHPKNAFFLLSLANTLDLHVVGISFHVGSGCQDPEAYGVTIKQAAEIFSMGRQLGFGMELLDIGGGYPGKPTAHATFEDIADVINIALDKYFPETEGVRIIAEPGSYFVDSAFSLSVNIIAKRVEARDCKALDNGPVDCVSCCDEPVMMYYVNDGVFGSFISVLFGSVSLPVSLVQQDQDVQYTTSIWGPTCDSSDCILKDCKLPELQVGDWIYFENMGAYTMSLASTFNGMPRPQKFFWCLSEIWYETFPDIPCNVDHCIKTVPQIKSYRNMLESADPDTEKLRSSPIESNRAKLEITRRASL